MSDRQISIRSVAYKLPIPTTTVYVIMSNHLDMKKVSRRWVRKLLTPIQRANRLDYYQELLQECQVNLDNYFDRIVTILLRSPQSTRSQMKKEQVDFVE